MSEMGARLCEENVHNVCCNGGTEHLIESFLICANSDEIVRSGDAL